MFTNRLTGCVSLVLLVIGSETTGVQMVEEACFNTARVCFEPYIQSGEIPAENATMRNVMDVVFMGEVCRERVEMFHCIVRTMENCTDDFKVVEMRGHVSVNAEDIFVDWMCEHFGGGACNDNYYNQCEYETPPVVIYEYPSTDYAFNVEVDVINEICKEVCLADMMTFCPYMSIMYARAQIEKIAAWSVLDSSEEPIMVDFINYTCPLIPETDLQCAIDQMAGRQFTQCVDLALHDHMEFVMHLNMVDDSQPVELHMNCQVLEDMNDCIDMSIGGGCDGVTAQVIKDGLFILDFRFNMSTCGPDSAPSRNGAIYLVADTWTMVALASGAWLLTAPIHALMLMLKTVYI